MEDKNECNFEFLIAVSAILFVVSGAILYGLKNRLENVYGFEAVKAASAALTIWIFLCFPYFP